MARPLRYEAAGAVYHVMARGDGGKTVFEDDKDRFAWVDLITRVCERFGWRVHAWVLMGNHFHVWLETPEPNLVAGMGEKSFAEKVLATLSGAELAAKKQKRSVGGDAAKAHDQAEAERIVRAGLAAMGLPDDPASLPGRGKWLQEKAVVAALVRKRTGVGNRWIAGRLGMGHEGNVTRAARLAKEDAATGRRLEELEKQLVLDFRD